MNLPDFIIASTLTSPLGLVTLFVVFFLIPVALFMTFLSARRKRNARPSLEKQFEELQQLKDNHLITEEEYKARRAILFSLD